ncbi:MAG: hypothetical protein GY822_05605 [Deltaproteobacteria bacterium]|nr:hypothetical protein [Deltaproteobacteria bacterium]
MHDVILSTKTGLSAGTPIVEDAGMSLVDAGATADAGSTTDAGAAADAGSSTDAGAATANDAGADDAGS